MTESGGLNVLSVIRTKLAKLFDLHFATEARPMELLETIRRRSYQLNKIKLFFFWEFKNRKVNSKNRHWLSSGLRALKQQLKASDAQGS